MRLIDIIIPIIYLAAAIFNYLYGHNRGYKRGFKDGHKSAYLEAYIKGYNDFRHIKFPPAPKNREENDKRQH